MDEHRITFQSGGLELEGMLREDDGALAALVLHPHPQYGGDMDNHVVMALCAALSSSGATTLRFNFRGAGRSQGTFDGGRGEADDALAAVAQLRERAGEARLVLAGYSFGAVVAARIASSAGAKSVILVSPRAGMMQTPELQEGVTALLITGGRDAIASPEAVRAYAGTPATVVVVPEADHGWWPGMDALQTAVFEFVAKLGARS